MHYGDNGILKGAEYAVDKYQNKAEQEQNELAKIDDYIQNGRETVNMPKRTWELLASTTNTTETEKTVKDLKQFSEVAIVSWYNQEIFASTEISYDIFSVASGINASSHTGAIRIGTCKYVNDTTVKLMCNGMTKVDLYGIH